MDEPELLLELPRLTARQTETLAWFFAYWSAHRHAPTQREIARGLGASSRTTTAARLVDPLVRRGYLTRIGSVSRNLRLTEQAVAKLKLEGVFPTH